MNILLFVIYSLDELDELDHGIELNLEPEITIDEDLDEVIYGKNNLTSFSSFWNHDKTFEMMCVI